METHEVEVIESVFNEDNTSFGKYGEDDPIVCRSPLGNNHICGKRYRNLPNFIRHLEKPNIHGMKIGEAK